MPKRPSSFEFPWFCKSLFSKTTRFNFSLGSQSKAFYLHKSILLKIIFFEPCFRILIVRSLQSVLLMLSLPYIHTLYLRKYRSNFFHRGLNRKFSTCLSVIFLCISQKFEQSFHAPVKAFKTYVCWPGSYHPIDKLLRRCPIPQHSPSKTCNKKFSRKPWIQRWP